jgi:hypothetical protein
MRHRLPPVLGLALVALVAALTSPVPAWAQCTAPITFEDGTLQGFTIEPVFGPPLWHNANNVCRAQLPGHSTTHTLYYGQDGTCDFETGDRNAANAISPQLTLPDPTARPVTLKFNYLLSGENGTSFDLPFGDISIDDGATWKQVFSKRNLENDNQWHQNVVHVGSALAGFIPGSPLRVRFRFDTGDEAFNATTGWHIDDVVLCGPEGIPTLSPLGVMILVLLVATTAIFLLRRRHLAGGSKHLNAA